MLADGLNLRGTLENRGLEALVGGQFCIHE